MALWPGACLGTDIGRDFRICGSHSRHGPPLGAPVEIRVWVLRGRFGGIPLLPSEADRRTDTRVSSKESGYGIRAHTGLYVRALRLSLGLPYGNGNAAQDGSPHLPQVQDPILEQAQDQENPARTKGHGLGRARANQMTRLEPRRQLRGTNPGSRQKRRRAALEHLVWMCWA